MDDPKCSKCGEFSANYANDTLCSICDAEENAVFCILRDPDPNPTERQEVLLLNENLLRLAQKEGFHLAEPKVEFGDEIPAIDVLKSLRKIGEADAVELKDLVLNNVDVETAILETDTEEWCFDRYTNERPPTAVLSWKWDVTNNVPEDEYWAQSSRNLVIALKKAAEVGIKNLCVDAVSLKQYPINVQQLTDFVLLYSKLRVVTTYVAEEWQYRQVSCPSYPRRAWILEEASRYLTNRHVTLNDLVTIRRSAQGPDSTEDKKHGYQYPMVDFCHIVMKPFTVDRQNEPSFFHPQIMPTRDDGDRPVTDCFNQIYGRIDTGAWQSTKRFSFVMVLCSCLAKDGCIWTEIDDLIKMSCNVLFGPRTMDFLLSLIQPIDEEGKKAVIFLSLLLFVARFHPSLVCDSSKSFRQRFARLLARARIPFLVSKSMQEATFLIVPPEPEGSNLGMKLVIGGTSSCRGMEILLISVRPPVNASELLQLTSAVFPLIRAVACAAATQPSLFERSACNEAFHSLF